MSGHLGRRGWATRSAAKEQERLIVKDLNLPRLNYGTMNSATLTPEVDYALRFANVEDIAFIFDSYCANQSDSLTLRDVSPEVVKVELRARIRRLMSPLASFVMAAPTAEYFIKRGIPPHESEVWGWVCYSYDKKTSSPVIHFLYVKQQLRGRGIARTLLHKAAGLKEGAHFWSTHLTPPGRRLLNRYGGSFNPFILDYVSELSDARRG